jgi:hypothetical protein
MGPTSSLVSHLSVYIYLFDVGRDFLFLAKSVMGINRGIWTLIVGLVVGMYSMYPECSTVGAPRMTFQFSPGFFVFTARNYREAHTIPGGSEAASPTSKLEK